MSLPNPDPSPGLLPSPEAIRAHLARGGPGSLAHFIRAAWHLVEPDKPLVWNWHIDVLCEVLESVTAGRLKRVIINIPPGCMKSLLVSVFWPAWEWAQQPGLRYLTASYGAHLAIRDNLRLREIVTSSWFKTYFPGLELSSDQNAKERFDTIARGWRIGTSVGGVATGEHPDRIVIDDPLTAEHARSSVERDSVNHWFDRTISTRGVVRDTRVVVIAQRLHEDDLPGHLLAKNPPEGSPGHWTHVCLPMHFDPARRDPRDTRTQPGALLWPALFSEAAVRQLEFDLTPYGAAGQLEQRPGPEGGGLFKRSWFKIVDIAPAAAKRVRGWDTAGTPDDGDWTVGVKIAEDPAGMIYVEHVVRTQEGPGAVDALILQTATLDGRGTLQREEREPGSSGKAVTAARAKLLRGYDYAEVPTSGDKVTRARPFRAQCEAGNVHLVRGAWNEAYLSELEQFPMGKHDDQVDGSSAAYNSIVQAPAVLNRATWGRR